MRDDLPQSYEDLMAAVRAEAQKWRRERSLGAKRETTPPPAENPATEPQYRPAGPSSSVMVIEYRQDGSSMWHRSISEAARRANVSVGKLRALIYWDLPSRYGSHYDLMAGSPYHLEPYWLQKRLRFRLVPDAKETT